jgi:hypothetical protein
VPGERLAEHFPGEVEVRLDHLGARQGPLATRGQPVGDSQQRDVGRDRLGRDQVVVDRPPRQRSPMNQEAEPQVMEREALEVGAELAAHPEPAADLGDDLRADLVVADEGHVPGALRACPGLAEVVEERAEPQRLAAREPVRQRLVQKGIDVRRQGSGKARHVPLEAEPLLQHGKRVAEYVEVVIRVLDDASERLQLG